MNKRLAFLLILLILVPITLAACGGDDDNESDTPSGNGDDTTAVQTGDRNYNIQITGDAEATIPPGLSQGEHYTGSDPHYELFFGQMSHSVFFRLSDSITTGTHDLTAYQGGLNTDAPATVEVTIAVDPDDIAQGAEDYDEEITGTLTLDEIGDTASGSFEFSATFIDTDENDQEIRKTISVTGSFTDLEMRATE